MEKENNKKQKEVLSATLCVRKKSRELYIWESTTFKDLIFDAFTVPVARVGESIMWQLHLQTI